MPVLPGQDSRTLRIMVVEDDALIGMLLADMLEGMGHDVCAVAASQPDAVAAARRCKPDLMLVDARLREGCGIAAVTEILRSGYIPHAFVTGDTAEVHSIRPHAVVIDKPFREQDLAQGIRRALASDLVTH
jgi:two-component system, response regulator PdtaR